MSSLIDYHKHYNKALTQATHFLLQNSLVIVPTETVYGLAGRALSSHAVKKIYQVKQRPSNNPLILHVSSYVMASQYGIFPSKASFQSLIDQYWPGPLTIVVPSSTFLFGETGLSTIAIRFSQHPFLIDLISTLGEPLFIPSANFSGKPSGTCLEMIPHSLQDQVACIIFGEKAEYGLESTVINLLNPNQWSLLRPGKISQQDIQKILIDFTFQKSNEQQKNILSPGTQYPHYKPHGVKVFLAKYSQNVQPYFSNNLRQRMITSFSNIDSVYKGDIISFKKMDELIHQFYYLLFKAEQDQIQQLFFIIPNISSYPDLWDRLKRTSDHILGFDTHL